MATRYTESPPFSTVHLALSSVLRSIFDFLVCSLSQRPNVDVRKDLERAHGLIAYKDMWRRETTHRLGAKTLPQIVKDWHGVTNAFTVRNKLVHGRDRYTQNMVRPGINAILAGVRDICSYSAIRGVDINQRLPQRRQKKPVEEA